MIWVLIAIYYILGVVYNIYDAIQQYDINIFMLVMILMALWILWPVELFVDRLGPIVLFKRRK